MGSSWARSRGGALAGGAAVLASSAAMLAVGCLLTSNFDGVVGAPPDAATDAADAAEADAGPADAPDATPFCEGLSPKPLVCSDFDEGSLLGTTWTESQVGGGANSLDTADFTSPPASYQTSVPGIGANAKATAILIKHVTAIGKTYHYAFDMRIESCHSSGGSTTLAAITPASNAILGLILPQSGVLTYAQRVNFSDGGNSFTPYPVVTSPKIGAWTRVALDVTLGGQRNQVKVTVDGAPALATSADSLAPDGTPILLNLGANVDGAVDGCKIEYDNVVFDVSP